MLKSLFLIAALPATWILFMQESAFSLPQVLGFQDPIVPLTDTAKPVCYMQTTDGRTLDLSRMCRVNDSKNRQLQPSQPTGQLSSNQDASTNSFDSSQLSSSQDASTNSFGSSQLPPPAIYTPTGSPY